MVCERRRTLTVADGVVHYFELCPRAGSRVSPLRRTATTHFVHGELFDWESLDVYSTAYNRVRHMEYTDPPNAVGVSFSISYRGGPSVCPSQVGILVDNRHVVDRISLAYSESVIFLFLEYRMHASLDCAVLLHQQSNCVVVT